MWYSPALTRRRNSSCFVSSSMSWPRPELGQSFCNNSAIDALRRMPEKKKATFGVVWPLRAATLRVGLNGSPGVTWPTEDAGFHRLARQRRSKQCSRNPFPRVGQGVGMHPTGKRKISPGRASPPSSRHRHSIVWHVVENRRRTQQAHGAGDCRDPEPYCHRLESH